MTEQERQRTQWEEEGYLVLRELFNPALTASLHKNCDRALEKWLACDPDTGQPGHMSTYVMRHLDRPEYTRENDAQRIEILEAAAMLDVLNVARAIFSEEPMYRCTSYWFNPREGRQDGNWHRDSQFSLTDETKEREHIEHAEACGDGLQMQIALVASDDVEFVPGSHKRWDTPEEHRIRLAEKQKNCRSNEMPGALRIALQPGDAVLFNSLGLHRGRYHADKPRRTLMLTYTRTSRPCRDYFSRQPWMLEDGALAGLKPETRAFYTKFVEQYRDFWCGVPV